MTSWGYIRADRVTLLLDFPTEPLLAVADGATSWRFGGFLDGQAVLFGLAASGVQVCTVHVPAAHVRAVVEHDRRPAGRARSIGASAAPTAEREQQR